MPTKRDAKMTYAGKVAHEGEDAVMTDSTIDADPFGRASRSDGQLNEKNFRGAPICDGDPFSLETMEDPFPLQREVREAGPVVWMSKYQCWAVAGFQEVKAVLGNWQTYCSSRGIGLTDFAKEKPWRVPSPLLEGDPPDHTQLRAVLNRVLSPSAVKKLRDQFATVAHEMVGDLVARGRIDAVNDLAEAFPLRVLPDVFGIARGGEKHLLPFGSLVFNSFGPDNELRRAAFTGAAEHIAWFSQQSKRENLAPDSFGAEFYASADRGEIPAEHASMLVRAMVAAGLDTTVNAIAAAVECFARFPCEWDKLRADPALARTAFEETVRYASPFQVFFRTTTRPTEIGDVHLEEGEKVMMFLGAANRDPRHWEDPDRFDISRRVSGHVGFGNGIHMCAGQFLSRLEGEVLLTELAKRVERFEICGTPTRKYNNSLRGLESLPVKLLASA